MQGDTRLFFVHGSLSFDASCTSDLISLLGYAVAINRPMYSTTDISFYALLFALLVANDRWSKWFQEQVRIDSVDVDALLAVKSFTRDRLNGMTASIEAPEVPTSLRATATSFQWVQAAVDSIQDPNESLDVQHVLYGLFSSRTKRQGTLEKAGLRSAAFLEAFNRYLNPPIGLSPREEETARLIARGYSNRAVADELAISERTVEMHVANIYRKLAVKTRTELIARLSGTEESPGGSARSQAPEPPPAEEPTQVPSFSAHIESDLWTTNDRLNYKTYCDAIRAFVVSPKTTFPLSVSVQAQWGGGKSSLMRMIRAELDPLYRGKKDPRTRAAEQADGSAALRLREAAKTVDQFRSDGVLAPTDALPTPASSNFHLTVWFNAWKYESSDQVWAGLVDAIIREISSRMDVEMREKFFLRLNLRRIDPEKVRAMIYERAFAKWLKAGAALWTAGAAVIGSAVGFAISTLDGSVLANAGLHAPLSAAGLTASCGVLGFVGTFIATFLNSIKKTDDEEAAVALRDLVSAPDYRSSLGFVHDVEADLRRVLDIVPDGYWPIVVFIDDLDRCAPETIGQVMEGINLFLAGDFPDFVFILGMDAELVAAALDAMHQDVLAHLEEGVKTPLGWRFMDKFVQLPFLIPPASDLAYENYVNGLLVHANTQEDARPRATVPPAGASPPLDSDGHEPAGASFEAERVRSAERLQHAIATYDETDSRTKDLLIPALGYFARNPRDVKRFLNGLRLHNFVAHAATVAEPPSLRQIVAWTVVCTKWPQLARWVRRDADVVGADGTGSDGRLSALEQTASGCTSFADWQTAASTQLGLHAAATDWLGDPELFRFLRDQSLTPHEERLSAGRGRGLY